MEMRLEGGPDNGEVGGGEGVLERRQLRHDEPVARRPVLLCQSAASEKSWTTLVAAVDVSFV